MSLLDIALLPIRVGLGVAHTVLQAVTPASPAPPSELVVIDGMPEGVPAAALRPEPALPAPAEWPFGEEFPRTCGTSRFAGGALFWTDFLYDDHGATGVLVDIPTGGLVPPRGTYVYPAGPAARNGADIFRVAVPQLTAHFSLPRAVRKPIAQVALETSPGQIQRTTCRLKSRPSVTDSSQTSYYYHAGLRRGFTGARQCGVARLERRSDNLASAVDCTSTADQTGGPKQYRQRLGAHADPLVR